MKGEYNSEMRILVVNTFYYPNMTGGAEQSVKLLAEGLCQKGHQVAVYCVDSKDGKCEISEHNGVKIYRYTTNRFNLYKFSYDKKSIGKVEKIHQKLISLFNRKCVKDFEFVCVDFKPEVIHTNSVYGMSQMVWRKAYKMKIPVVHTIRDIGIVSPVQYGHKANKLLMTLHKSMTRYTTGFVSAVTAPSQYTLQTSLDTGSFSNVIEKQCIFNSVEINIEEIKKIIAEKRSRTDKKIKFMYAGRLIYFKGIEHMIEAFECIHNQNCELHICGNGNMKEFVEEWAKKDIRIIYHGKLNNKQLADMYDECDVLLMPSCWPEPFGRVLIEGNIHGMPVIAGKCGGIPEIIDTTKGGVLYEAGNAGELAEKMEMMLKRELYHGYFDSIIRSIDTYNIKHQLNAFLHIYNIVTQSKNNPDKPREKNGKN